MYHIHEDKRPPILCPEFALPVGVSFFYSALPYRDSNCQMLHKQDHKISRLNTRSVPSQLLCKWREQRLVTKMVLTGVLLWTLGHSICYAYTRNDAHVKEPANCIQTFASHDSFNAPNTWKSWLFLRKLLGVEAAELLEDVHIPTHPCIKKFVNVIASRISSAQLCSIESILKEPRGCLNVVQAFITESWLHTAHSCALWRAYSNDVQRLSYTQVVILNIKIQFVCLIWVKHNEVLNSLL